MTDTVVEEKIVINSNQQKIENRQTLFEKAFCTVWIMVIAYMIIRPVTNNASLIRLIWIPSLIVLFLLSINRTMTWRLFIEIVIPTVIIMVSMLIQSGALNQEHILSAFCYINMFLVINMCSKTVPSKKTFDYIYYSNVFLSLLFAIYTFTPIAYRVHSDGRVWRSIYYVFDLGNSNLAAMSIFSFYCVLLINLSYRKRKAPIILLMIYDLYMIYGTNCRSVLITVIIVTLAFIFLGKRKLPRGVILIGTLIPALFVFIYLTLFNRFGGQGIIVFNKSLFSGRQENFLEYLGFLRNWWNILFGNFAEAGFQNAHNSIVSVLTSVGAIGLVCFYAFYLRTLGFINENESSAVRTISLICILGLFIQSSMEASYFLGGFPGVMFLSTFILLSNYKDDVSGNNEDSSLFDRIRRSRV